MQRAGAMNLLSFLMNDMTEENRKLKLIIFPGETVVIDEYGKRIVACPTEDEAEEYRALLDVDFNNVKIEDLTDIRKIKIDKNQPQSKRQAQFLKQVGNPYMLRRGSMMIKVSFANNGLSMEQAFENLLLNV